MLNYLKIEIIINLCLHSYYICEIVFLAFKKAYLCLTYNQNALKILFVF